MRKLVITFLLLVIAGCSIVTAQVSNYFSASSPTDAGSNSYGTIQLDAGKQTLIIGTIMAYGENVKALNIQINKGFVFKLAPAQNGLNLNYIGTSMNIVLQPGDKAFIEFSLAGKGPSIRQLHVSGERFN